jgi:positive regulator of sigma E activity
MREIGKIVNIEREKVSLAITGDEACASCGGGMTSDGAAGCPGCSVFGSKNVKTIDAVNRKHLSLDVGDMVVVYLQPRKTVWAAFLLFIFPLLVFFAGYTVLGWLVPPPAESVKILCGVAGIAISYLVLFLVRKVRKTKDWPEVVGKYDPEDGKR